MMRINSLVVALLIALDASGEQRPANANDGSSAPPRLMIVQSMWGMTGLPTRPMLNPAAPVSRTGTPARASGGPDQAIQTEWSLDEKLTRIAKAGFDGIDMPIPQNAEEERRVQDVRSRYGLETVLLLFTGTDSMDPLDRALTVARRTKSPWLDVHAGSYLVPEDEARRFLSDMVEHAGRQGVAVLVQTHRGRVTQDLLRTVAYAKAIPGLRFCLDLSHYFVAGEIGDRLTPEADALVGVLIGRASMLDGRVSNGEQVQVDMGPQVDNKLTQYFAELWKRTMIAWLAHAGAGDVFIFRVELGPPSYSILDLNGREISDRWEQATLMRALVERLWNEAVRETGRGTPHASRTAVNRALLRPRAGRWP
jgi:hypothetical protein